MPAALRRTSMLPLVIAVVATLLGGPLTGRSAAAESSFSPLAGVYVGPGAKNLAGAAAFSAWSGLRMTDLVDFPPTGQWTGPNGLTGPSWLLDPYKNARQAGTTFRLEYSLPMLPNAASTNLVDCAAGAYDQYWTETATNLMAAGLADTIVRPGWEMNGGWYRWAAAGKAEAYAGCFRKIVTAMRAVPGNAFTFDFTSNLGRGTFAAEEAYPGDAYVDYVGVDTYDLSWTWYPLPAGVDAATAAERAWAWILKGDHGLKFWRDFAAARGKKMSIPEWGATFRTDGRAGGDNPIFVNHMIDFMLDPANNVGVAHYFNIDAGSVKHDLIKADSSFPLAGEKFRQRVATLGTAPVVTTPVVVPAPVVTPKPTANTPNGGTPNGGTPNGGKPVVTPTTPAPLPIKPALTLTASAAKVGLGGSVTLDATATRVQGTVVAPLAGARATLETGTAGTWRTIGTATTGADGKVRFTVKPTAATSYRVSVTDNGTTVSATRDLTVTAAIGSRLTAASVKKGKDVTLYADVAPKPVKGVRVTVERLVAGKWSMAAQVLTDAKGTAKWRPSTKARGTFTYRVRVPANAALGSGVGGSLVLRVR